MSRCKNCGAEIPEGQKYCGACGFPVEDPEYMRKLRPCKTCGKMVARSARVCPNCGKKLKHPLLRLFIFLVILVLFALGLYKFEKEKSCCSFLKRLMFWK